MPTRQIKAAVLREFNKPVTIEELELADPKEHEVQVKVLAVGFCHSDLHVFLREIVVPLPMVLGHEMAGVVEKVGPGVTRVKPGDRVVASFTVPCGKCFQCLKGRPNICEGNFGAFVGGNLVDGTSRFTDKDGNRVGQGFFIGGFATHTIIPELGAHRVPDHIETPPEHLCQLGCSIPTGWGSVVHDANAKAGTSIAVYGCGAIGLNAIRGAALRNATPVIAVDLEASKKGLAMEMGATHFIDSSKDDPVSKIQEFTGGAGVEYAIEAIGDPGAIIQCGYSLRMGGSVILIGLCPAESTTNLSMLLIALQDKAIVGTLYGKINPLEDIPRLMELQATGALKTDKLITEKIKLEDINYAASEMLDRKVVGRWVITP